MRPWPVLALILQLAAGAPAYGSDEGAEASNRGAESPVAPPAYPQPEDYLPFDVSATTPFTFFVDAKSVSVGADGEVRYTAIAKSAGGALNVSFEGMRCAAREFRIYALGRADHTWSKARDSEWRAIRLNTRNAQRRVLYEDFFCPNRINIRSAAEGVRMLKIGGKSRAVITD